MYYSREKNKLFNNITEIRQEFPSVGFSELNDEVLRFLKLYPLELGARPTFDSSLQKPQIGSPVESIIGVDENGNNVYSYSINWVLVDLTDEEKAAQQEHIARQRNYSITSLRKNRNILIERSDWTQLPDAPLTTEQKAAWATYRQQLRDLTTQEGFPDNVTWPTAPGTEPWSPTP